MSWNPLHRSAASRILWALVLVWGCGGNVVVDSSGGGGTGGSGQKTRRCGMGAPCSGGATCSYGLNPDQGVSCNCDPSGHYMCQAGGGASPPWPSCSMSSACGQGGAGGTDGCSQNNGYCVWSCACNGGCSYQCDGKGPAQGDPGTVCDDSYCGSHPYSGDCVVDDGACTYTVSCNGATAIVNGSCPN